MEKLKEIFSPHKKDSGESSEVISAKETDTGSVRPLESVAPFSQDRAHSQQVHSQHHEEGHLSQHDHHLSQHNSQVTPHHGQEHSQQIGSQRSSTDPREINEQPAKEKMHAKLAEHPDKHPLVTTTTTTTHTPQKDVTSTATMNPVSETYTTTISYKKEDT